jgi:hypothetical protein
MNWLAWCGQASPVDDLHVVALRTSSQVVTDMRSCSDSALRLELPGVPMCSDQPKPLPPTDHSVFEVDVRNALTVIIGRAQLLQRRLRRHEAERSDVELLRGLDIILSKSRHLAAVLDHRERPK